MGTSLFLFRVQPCNLYLAPLVAHIHPVEPGNLQRHTVVAAVESPGSWASGCVPTRHGPQWAKGVQSSG